MVSSAQLVLFFNLILLTASEDPKTVNLTLLTDIINCASKYHRFNVIPILATRNTILDMEEFIISVRRPIHILSVVRPNTNSPFKDLHETLTIAFFQGIVDNVFGMTDIFTRGRRLACILFVLTRPASTHRDIHRILIHAWRNNYMRAILLYRDNQGQDRLVSYDVYDNFRIKNVFDDYRVLDIFELRSVGNMNQYEIQSPVKGDMPRVFEVKTFKGHKQFVGYSYQLFMTYVKYMNATFKEYRTTRYGDSDNLVMKEIFQLITDGVIEISLHPFNRPQITGIQSSYPILFNDICVMMPMVNEVPSYMFLKRPFHFGVWLLVVFGTVYLSISLMLIPANSSDRRRDLGWSFLQGLGYMLNIASFEYKYNITWRYFFVHMACWILGFIVTAWYYAILNGFWASTTFGTQIDTIEDFLALDLNILVKDEEYESFIGFQHLPMEFRKRFIPADAVTLMRHRTAFNTSYAYTISTDQWEFLNLQQGNSRMPLFRLSNICIFSHVMSYQMEYDSRLQYSMKYFIMYAHQSGLLNYWMHSNFQQAVRMGYVKLMTNCYHVRPIRYEDLLLAFWMLAIGIGASAVVFMVELLLEGLQRLWRKMLGYIAEWGRKQVENYAEV